VVWCVVCAASGVCSRFQRTRLIVFRKSSLIGRQLQCTNRLKGGGKAWSPLGSRWHWQRHSLQRIHLNRGFALHPDQPFPLSPISTLFFFLSSSLVNSRIHHLSNPDFFPTLFVRDFNADSTLFQRPPLPPLPPLHPLPGRFANRSKLASRQMENRFFGSFGL